MVVVLVAIGATVVADVGVFGAAVVVGATDEVVVVVGTTVVVAIGATVVADGGVFGAAVVVGATDDEVVDSDVASVVVTVVDAVVVVLVEVPLEVGEAAAGRVVLVEVDVPD